MRDQIQNPHFKKSTKLPLVNLNVAKWLQLGSPNFKQVFFAIRLKVNHIDLGLNHD